MITEDIRHIRIPEAHTSLEHIYWGLIMYREIRLRHRPGCIYRWQEERPGFRENLYDSKCKKMAVADYLLRNFAKQLERYSFQAHGSGKSGIIQVTRCGQEVLERTACEIEEKTGNIIVRFEVGFPARGRTIQAGELIKILYQYLPACVEKALYYKNIDQQCSEAGGRTCRGSGIYPGTAEKRGTDSICC